MRPAGTEYAPYFDRYVSLVPEHDVIPVLAGQAAAVVDALGGLGDDRAGSRYADGKWTVGEVLGHLVDAEHVFGYRALALARGERASLPSFDEEAYAAASGHATVAIGDLAEEFAALRRSHVLMLSHLPPPAWSHPGVVNGHATTARAVAYVMAGHVRHHARILAARYGVALDA